MISKAENNICSILLSVVVVSVYTPESLGKCLDSILLNKKQEEVEIIVADGCGDKSFPKMIETYPNVCFLQFPGKTTIPVLAAAGLKQCNGKIIALTDSSCQVDSNWIASILKAHESSYLVIGGAVEKTGRLSLLDLAVYFCEYGQFMIPLRKGVAQVLPGNNISFKSSSLTKIGDEFWKSNWCAKMQNEGFDLVAEPSVLVYYHKNFRLIPLLKRRFYHGRCFAAMKTSQDTSLRRIFLGGASILLPILFFLRSTLVIFQKNRLFIEFFFSSPFIVLTIVSWSLGEIWGYFFGKGKSNEHIF